MLLQINYSYIAKIRKKTEKGKGEGGLFIRS